MVDDRERGECVCVGGRPETEAQRMKTEVGDDRKRGSAGVREGVQE